MPPLTADLKAILFDFGGTLDGDGVHWSSRFRKAWEREGVAVEPRRFDEAFAEADRRLALEPRWADASLAEIVAAQAQRQMELLGVDDPVSARRVAASAANEAAASLDGSRRVLARLRPRFRLGVVSNFTGALERVCRETGLGSVLELMVDSARVGVSKPDPGIFRLAVGALGVAAGECAMVGDSFDRDVAPARAAGLRAIWLRGPDPRPCPDPALPDATISSLAELPSLLLEPRVQSGHPGGR